MRECGSIDVIVPCYRYGHFLRECVESVLAERGRDVRVLIIDDASPDETPEVAADLARRDERVAWRRHAENRGHIATYNEGIEWAAADYMLILSADDLLTPGALARAGALLDAHPEVVLTYGPTLRSAGAVPESGAITVPWEIIEGSAFLWRGIRASCADPVATCTAVVRTKTQKAVGFYREDLPHAGDYEMWFRLAARGNVGRLRACQGIYRKHEGNMSDHYFAHLPRDIAQRTLSVDSFIKSEGANRPDAAALRRYLHAQNARLAVSYAAVAFLADARPMFDELMAMAVRLDPLVRFTGAWHKQKIKRLLGRQIWAGLKRPLQRFLPPAELA